MAIIPPDPIEANVDYRYDGCYQSMVLVLLQRVVDASGGGAGGLATEAKQNDQITLSSAANALLTSLEAKDYSTETTLEAVRVLIASLDGKDFATETTLLSIKTVVDNIKLDTAKLDVNLSTRATESTLELVRLLLVSLDGKDYATQTTLALVEGITSQMTFTGGDLNVNASVSLPAGLSTEAKQDAQIVLETAANALLTSLDGKDFATQTTLELIRLLLVALDGKDYSTETTLALIKPVLDAIKLDTAKLDVNLSTVATETTLAAIKAQTDQLTFTANKLRTTGEDGGGGGGGVSVFGDSGGYANLTPDGTNQLVLAADTDFKEVILYHENKKQGWIKFGGGIAVVGEGFPIKKKQPWILDRCRDEIRIIFESGFDSKDLQINTVKL